MEQEWFDARKVIPPEGLQVEIGYWYQDTWLKGKPWKFLRGFGEIMNVNDSRGLTWFTGSLGCSSNQVQYWKRVSPAPERSYQ